ncbi:bile acid:sodium symporter family protein [Pseudoteredinibacter isoporae]|uniref:BASS family bile acid:Na+ symporter n=1 Tax=Pseudoteredinibacter isoporae TaxID=570281 RepID=A0A7X0JSD4_9GAMM|nr:bile acid:sodium symporter [Pseudoteredinibacter isoporae]MBB6520964.1 BASS family bile acid:Na+ symporter [Pseudoteredinibacter isoporae]NHO86529.1 bile acid:sodium symporter family protein [Pseudoteredinibacter isoporae]NIB25019.1 bile acid:sodium symporter family protein [Pseudoteredinibacter isoporae]
MDVLTVNKIVLPIMLALMMLTMGLSLQRVNFLELMRQPKALALGVTLQLLILPLLAWLIILIFKLPAELAAGLLLISLAPGGASSNAISFLADGDVALSIALTLISSVVVPLLLPIMLLWHYSFLGMSAEPFQIPILPTITQLCLVSLFPIALGMLLQHIFPQIFLPQQKRLQKTTGLILVVLIVLMAWTNRRELMEIAETASFLLLCLCALAYYCGIFLGRLFGLSGQQQRTLGIETGIQNAGIAMMVAATLMDRPALAMIALFYGIGMNLPALLIIAQIRWRKSAAYKTS